jgi:hypothetical protein
MPLRRTNRVPYVKLIPVPPKTADRPHRITIWLTVGALVASTVSAILSYKALIINQTYAQAAQRAYLALRDYEMDVGKPIAGMPPTLTFLRFRANVSNGGNTPAWPVRVITSGYLERHEQDRVSAEKIPFLLAPKAEEPIELTIPVDPSYGADPKTFKGIVIIRGRIEYTTFFDEQDSYDWCVTYSGEREFQDCDWEKVPL